MSADLFTHDEAAKWLGVDPATLYRWRARRWISCRKRGRFVRYTLDDLKSCLDAMLVKAEGQPPSRIRKGDLKG
jgi:helix-turn-helix protein